MKKWFQVFIEVEGEEESIPMRINPDLIQGFRKYTSYVTMMYTTFGTFYVHEDYEQFCKRLFAFVNFEEFNKDNSSEITTTTTKKRLVIVKRAKRNEELEALQNYYDQHQPDTNS